jgi:hypothetical protein
MDLNVFAFRLVEEATSELAPEVKRKRSASSKGGIVGGRKRAEKLSAEKRREIALKANKARWSAQQIELQ